MQDEKLYTNRQRQWLTQVLAKDSMSMKDSRPKRSVFIVLGEENKAQYNKNHYNKDGLSDLFMEMHSFIHHNNCSDAKYSEGIGGLTRIEIILPKEEKEPKCRLTIKKWEWDQVPLWDISSKHGGGGQKKQQKKTLSPNVTSRSLDEMAWCGKAGMGESSRYCFNPVSRNLLIPCCEHHRNTLVFLSFVPRG